MDYFKTLTISFFIFLGACAEDLGEENLKNENNSSPVIAQVVEVQNLSPEFRVSLEEGSNPFEYSVRFDWENTGGKVRISQNAKVLAFLESSEKSFLHKNIPSEAQLTYLVEQLSKEGKVLTSLPVYLIAPKDIVVSGDVKLPESKTLEAHRIFLESNAKITTFSNNLHLIADEIISENALIENFPKDQKAPRERDGRSGGGILIQAKKTRGFLRVVLSGEQGGLGRDGARTMGGHPGCAGTSGGAGGRAGDLNIEVLDSHALTLTYENLNAQGGKAGKRGVGSKTDSPENVVLPPCYRDQAEGNDGFPGGKGRVCLKVSSANRFVCKE